MGYTVKRGGKVHGHYETKKEAYAAMKYELCQGNMPTLLHLSSDDSEHFQHFLGEISVIPDPQKP